MRTADLTSDGENVHSVERVPSGRRGREKLTAPYSASQPNESERKKKKTENQKTVMQKKSKIAKRGTVSAKGLDSSKRKKRERLAEPAVLEKK